MKKIKTLKLTANKFGLVNTKPVNRKKQVNNRLNPWSSKPIKIHSQNSKLSFGSKHKYNYNMSSTTRPTYHKRTKPIKMHFGFDTDRDGVKDHRDCRPFNPRKQHVDEGDWMDTDEPQPSTYDRTQDWMSTKKKKPRISRHATSQSGEAIAEVLDTDTLKDAVCYKNYEITFYKHKKEFVVGPYEGHPQTDIYLPGVVYAHGFKQDPASRRSEPGKVIATGKTVKEAIRQAKRWIDRQERR